MAKVCESALEFRKHPNALFVNYNQLPEFVTAELLGHFRVEYSDEEIDLMNSAARSDAKSPNPAVS